MVSNTGFSSPGERLMTPRTSDVAVCCSSDSVSSRVRACTSSNNRTFSIAITAWSAKVLTQIDLLVGEGLNGQAQQRHDADGRAFAQQRNAQHGPEAEQLAGLVPSVFGIGGDVRNVDDSSFQRRAPYKGIAAR